MRSSKAVFVTGGSSGLGFETARVLASKGWKIGLFARDRSRLAQARSTLQEEIPESCVDTYCGDVTDDSSLQAAVQKFAGRHGGLEAAVHAAGQMRALGPTSAVRADQWLQDLEVTLLGAGRLAAAAEEAFDRQKTDGAVAAFVGPGVHGGLGFASAYAAAQAGLVRLFENLALERTFPSSAGPSPGSFVGYYTIFPAVTPTGLMEHVLASPEGRKWLPRFTEMFGEGKEVEPRVPAAMVAWLCERKPRELSGRVVSGMLDPELTEMRLAILGEGEKGRLRVRF